MSQNENNSYGVCQAHQVRMTSNAGCECSLQRMLFYKHLQSMKRRRRNHVLILQPNDLVIINSLKGESLQHRATVLLHACSSLAADLQLALAKLYCV